jgi:hypothetical protein
MIEHDGVTLSGFDQDERQSADVRQAHPGGVLGELRPRAVTVANRAATVREGCAARDSYRCTAGSFVGSAMLGQPGMAEAARRHSRASRRIGRDVVDDVVRTGGVALQSRRPSEVIQTEQVRRLVAE